MINNADFKDNQKKTIVAVSKFHNNISQVKFETGEIVDIKEAIKMAELDQINHVNTGSTRGDDPHKTLRSNPDGDPSNNLDNLPQF